MPRKPSTEPMNKLTTYVPEAVSIRVTERLKDPVTNKTKHGALSKLITSLLIRWLNEGEQP